jgi:hypothetical protein
VDSDNAHGGWCCSLGVVRAPGGWLCPVRTSSRQRIKRMAPGLVFVGWRRNFLGPHHP